MANVVPERPYGPGGAETRRGTRLLAPGAKVFVFPHLWDSHGDYARLMVIGRHRASHRFVTLIMPARLLTNWRVDIAYSPHVIRSFLEGLFELFWWKGESTEENLRRLRELTWNGMPEAKVRAEQMVALMRELFPEQAEDTTEDSDADRCEP